MSLKKEARVTVNSFADMPHQLKEFFNKYNIKKGDHVTLKNGRYHEQSHTKSSTTSQLFAWDEMIVTIFDGNKDHEMNIHVGEFSEIWAFATEFTVKGCHRNKYSVFVM